MSRRPNDRAAWRRAASVAGVLAALLPAPGLAAALPADPVAGEGKAELLRRPPGATRSLGACGVVPDHYPPADPDPPIDVLGYQLWFDLDVAARTVRATAAVTVRVLHDALAAVPLDYCGPPPSAAREGATPRPFTHDGDLLSVALERPRARGDTVTVAVDYQGRPERGIHWAPPQYPESPATFTFSEPQNARWWFPCRDRPDDKATLAIEVAVPEGHVVGSNGRLEAERADTLGGRPRRVFRWVEEQPIATYLIAFYAAPYAVLHDQRLPGVPIVHYVYRPDSASARRSFDRVPDMIRFFAERFGDYPFVKYGHAVALFPGGMEHQTLSLLTERAARDSAAYQALQAHELAHQWWGNSVTLEDWRHIWLNEGFATYGDALWHAHVHGTEDSLHARMALFGSFYRRAWFGGLDAPLVDPPARHLFSHVTYNKGAWVLHMLRRVVGDATFFAVLREYHRAHRHGVAGTEDFVAACERVAGGGLDWFFDPWLHGRGLPRYRYDWTTGPAPGGGAWVRVAVEQLQDTTFYPMPVDFELQTARGVRRETVFVDRDPFAFTVHLDDPPLPGGVILDPDGWILATVERAPVAAPAGPAARLAALRVLGSPGPAPLAIEAVLTAGEPAALRVDVHDLQGRRVARAFDGPAATGTRRVSWDGRIEGGGAARPGVYLARVRVGEQTATRRLVLLR